MGKWYFNGVDQISHQFFKTYEGINFRKSKRLHSTAGPLNLREETKLKKNLLEISRKSNSLCVN